MNLGTQAAWHGMGLADSKLGCQVKIAVPGCAGMCGMYRDVLGRVVMCRDVG